MNDKTEYLKELTSKVKATKAKIWIRVAKELSKPTRNQTEVSLGKLDSMAKDGFCLVVPGKILGTGSLSKKVDVATYQISDSARAKIIAAGGKVLNLEEAAKSYKDGKKLVLVK